MTTRLTCVEMACTRTDESGAEHVVKVLFTTDGWSQWNAQHSVLCDNAEFLDTLREPICGALIEGQAEEEEEEESADGAS